jgi:hypothetical protein
MHLPTRNWWCRIGRSIAWALVANEDLISHQLGA